MSIKDILMYAVVYPLNYPLWFLRELIFFVLLSPVIYLCLKYCKIYFLVFIFILGIFCANLLNFKIEIINFFFLFFFLLGSYLGIIKNKLEFSSILCYPAGIIFFVITIFLFIITKGIADNLGMNKYIVFFNHFRIFAGLLFVWLLYDKLKLDKKNCYLKKYYSYSFFIFVMHGLPINMLERFEQKLWFINELGLLYILNPIIIVTMCIITARFCQRNFNGVYKILTGHRG
jgi:hypothetical protein